MTFQALRAHIESKIFAVYQAENPPLPVVFDNTVETPPAMPYVNCLVSYNSMSTNVICQTDTSVEEITGNIMLSVYVKRGQGMKDLELYSQLGMQCLNTMYDWSSPVRVRCGPINGPVTPPGGPDPYAVATVSCAFTAKLD
jgi:hypothetical protein